MKITKGYKATDINMKNTVSRNTGDGNTGNKNTGNQNTDDRNIGDWNTGRCNKGDRNAGDWNMGDRNTGKGNVCNGSSGYFCTQETECLSFDAPSGLTHVEFRFKYGYLTSCLAHLLQEDEAIDVHEFSSIPNITQAKLDELHRKFKEARG